MVLRGTFFKLCLISQHFFQTQKKNNKQIIIQNVFQVNTTRVPDYCFHRFVVRGPRTEAEISEQLTDKIYCNSLGVQVHKNQQKRYAAMYVKSRTRR